MPVTHHELQVAHVADFYRRYPGEPVTLYTRVEVGSPLPGYRLRVRLSKGLRMEAHRAPPEVSDGGPQIVEREGGERDVVWHVQAPLVPGVYHDYEIKAVIESVPRNVKLVSQAMVAPLTFDGDVEAPDALLNGMARESVRIAVSVKGQYLRYLPALYQDDELMARFLMLFESFWAPREGIIRQLPFYFDPRTAPPDLLPWLASWLNLVLDEQWPEEKRRQLLEATVGLYRKRGTRRGLQEYLEIYTGTKPQIVEHRARNFTLGIGARLGPGIALGAENVPHTFTVILRLPPVEAGSEEEALDLQQKRRHVIERIIESEKPAHTAYTLQITNTS
jgi:phage tail-like protein